MTRKEAREIAFAIVFESSFHSEGLDYILENAADGRDLSLPDGSFAKELARITIEKRDEIDETIASCSNHWKPGRMAKATLAILRISVCEMMNFSEEVPASVSINEAVELAKVYGGDDDPSFVNGVLGAVYKKLTEGSEA
ncbi:MAG: transcription antitermination factor NusB [Oscillospiraceae bacterium]|nr:transcription antitermination factor NusB [Oscillospiraceae bacterium]